MIYIKIASATPKIRIAPRPRQKITALRSLHAKDKSFHVKSCQHHISLLYLRSKLAALRDRLIE
jgi:hypothetical protein